MKIRVTLKDTISYKDIGYANGLAILGKIYGEVEALYVPGSIKVTIELLM